jgi:hypothetical protein
MDVALTHHSMKKLLLLLSLLAGPAHAELVGHYPACLHGPYDARS